MEMAEHEENVKKERREDKKTIELLETDIDDLAETLCTKHTVLKEKLEALEQRLCSTKDEKIKFEALKEELEQRANKLEEEKIKFETLKEELEQRANKLEEETNSHSLDLLNSIPFEADLTIKHYNASISSLEHCRELLEVEDVRLEDDVNELKQDFMLQQQIKLNNQQREFFVRQWLADAVELHGTLGNVSVQSMQGDTVVLEIPSEVKAEDQPGPPLILTVKFRLEGGIQAVFAGAEINLDLLHIDDLVNDAIRTNNVVGFILAVKRRFRNQLSLITEVQELRANYAIDWEPSHGRIRVMLGRSGKVVCTLKVDPLCSTG